MLDISIIPATIRISAPYAAGALGGTLTERSGTVNIAIEGLMLTGAFAFACGAYYTNALWLPEVSAAHPAVPLLAGLLLAVGCAATLSLLHALVTIYFRANHIVSGLALNLLSLGLTDFLLQALFGSASNSPRVPVFTNANFFHELSAASWLKGIFHPVLLAILTAILLSQWLLSRTRLGLRLRAAGENPLAASAAGLRPQRYRLYGILLGAVVASLGGVWLVSEQGLFSSNMTAGRGYIALAAMILGRWKPLWVAVVCLFFGFAESLQNLLQVNRSSVSAADIVVTSPTWAENVLNAIPLQLIQALPYLLTIVVVAFVSRRPVPPAALGQPVKVD